jgi:hypothetical protein
MKPATARKRATEPDPDPDVDTAIEDARRLREWKARFCQTINTTEEGPAIAQALVQMSPVVTWLMQKYAPGKSGRGRRN